MSEYKLVTVKPAVRVMVVNGVGFSAFWDTGVLVGLPDGEHGLYLQPPTPAVQADPVAWRFWNTTIEQWVYRATPVSGLVSQPLYTHPPAPAVLADRERMSAALDKVLSLFCNAIDNLGDMPISDSWAAKWSRDAYEAVQPFMPPGYTNQPTTVKESVTPEQEREAFEAWAKHELPGRSHRLDERHTYFDLVVYHCWAAWQARAALDKGSGDG